MPLTFSSKLDPNAKVLFFKKIVTDFFSRKLPVNILKYWILQETLFLRIFLKKIPEIAEMLSGFPKSVCNYVRMLLTCFWEEKKLMEFCEKIFHTSKFCEYQK